MTTTRKNDTTTTVMVFVTPLTLPSTATAAGSVTTAQAGATTLVAVGTNQSNQSLLQQNKDGSKKTGAGGIAAGVLIAVGAGIWYRCQGIRSQQPNQNFLDHEASRNTIAMETNPLSVNAGAGGAGGSGAGAAPADGVYYSEIADNVHQQDADGYVLDSSLAATAATESIVYATYASSSAGANANAQPYTAPNDVAVYATPLDFTADATPYAVSHPEESYSPSDGGVAYASSSI